MPLYTFLTRLFARLLRASRARANSAVGTAVGDAKKNSDASRMPPPVTRSSGIHMYTYNWEHKYIEYAYRIYVSSYYYVSSVLILLYVFPILYIHVYIELGRHIYRIHIHAIRTHVYSMYIFGTHIYSIYTQLGTYIYSAYIHLYWERSIRQHTSAYASIRQHTSNLVMRAYVLMLTYSDACCIYICVCVCERVCVHVCVCVCVCLCVSMCMYRAHAGGAKRALKPLRTSQQRRLFRS
jgi:hypothetical protein